MTTGNNLKTKSRFQGLLFALLVLLGGAIVMLADQQAERKKFLEYSDLVYQGIAQRLLTAEGAITALVNFDHDSTIDGNIAHGVLQDLVKTYPYLYALAKLDWVRWRDRNDYEKHMQEEGMAEMTIREYDKEKDAFVKASIRSSYLVTSILIPWNQRHHRCSGWICI